MKIRLFTSESVTEGHPDKMADQISDGILDAILVQDPEARVAAETLVSTGMVIVSGEISTQCYIDIPQIVRSTVKEIGYNNAAYGFDCATCAVLVSVDEQSDDIAMGVDQAYEVKQGLVDGEIEAMGAGDQGMMFGYASNETDTYMPMPIYLAKRLAIRLSEVRKSGEIAYLRPDGKTQVTVEYHDDQPVRVDTIVVATQHNPEATQDELKQDIIEKVIKPTLPSAMLDTDTKFYINPTGRFVIGGPQGDCGLTGRKIIVDTYGGMGRHGGGAFSGKDPTKVDRSASYAARYVAKNLVAAGIAQRCEVQLAYAIGVAQPISISVDCFGTGMLAESDIVQLIRDHFDLRPAAIIRDLALRRPIYKATASYGPFGHRNDDFTWERTDKAAALRKAAGL